MSPPGRYGSAVRYAVLPVAVPGKTGDKPLCIMYGV